MEILEYVDEQGESPFARWFGNLDARAAAKVTIAIVRMGQGNLASSKSVGEGVLENRIDWGPGYRVYFGRDGAALIILLCGGTKRRQQDDIADAKSLWAAYKQRKRKG